MSGNNLDVFLRKTGQEDLKKKLKSNGVKSRPDQYLSREPHLGNDNFIPVGLHVDSKLLAHITTKRETVL